MIFKHVNGIEMNEVGNVYFITSNANECNFNLFYNLIS